MAYLEIESLGKRFGGADILHGVSLSLERGKILTLIGPSGEGKTTLLRCLNGLETPDMGVIRLNGETVFDAAAPKQRERKQTHRAFGLVFQAFHLFPQYTVLQNVMLAPSLQRRESKAELKARAMALLEKVGLTEKADSYPNTLSGGQQQRAAIARALAMEPDERDPPAEERGADDDRRNARDGVRKGSVGSRRVSEGRNGRRMRHVRTAV